MGMGYVGGFEEVISFENLELILPNECATLKKLWEEDGLNTLENCLAVTFCVAESSGNIDEFNFKIQEMCDANVLDENVFCTVEQQQENHIEIRFGLYYQAWNDIISAFEKLQKDYNSPVATLYMSYHLSENGDIYDDISGVFFAIDNVYQLTPFGKAIKNKFERKYYVTYC